MQWQTGTFVVRPNLGGPLLLAPNSLKRFQITIAGKSESIPSPGQLESWLSQYPPRLLPRLRSSSSDAVLGITKVHGRTLTKYPRFDADYSRGRLPVFAADHHYVAGFRWEYRVSVGIDAGQIEHLKPSAGWPLLLNLKFGRKTNYHALYIDDKFENMAQRQFTVIQVSDLHIAARNDRIPEILSRVRTAEDCEALRQSYNNFNDNFRGAIQYANANLAKGELAVVVATGDLVDYYHDGYVGGEFIWKAGKARMRRSNVKKLVDIVTGLDGRFEGLRCPLFTVMGNHDYLVHEVPLSLKVKLGGTDLTLPIIIYERNTYKQFNLTKPEAVEYDHWNMVSRFVGRRRAFRNIWEKIENGEKTPIPVVYSGARLDQDHGYWLIKPHYGHLRGYLEYVNYDTDHTFRVAGNQFLCFNTAQDRLPSTSRLVSPKHDWEKDYKNSGPHSAGINGDHVNLLEDALKRTPASASVFIFTHAPLVGLEKSKTDGIEVLYEEAHQTGTSSGRPANFLTELYGKSSRTLRSNGFALGGTRYSKSGRRDPYLNFSCADGAYLKLFGKIAPAMGMRTNRPVVVLSGHTHKVHQYRLEGPKTPREFGYSVYYYFMDQYTDQLGLTEDLSQKKAWLREHSPLLLTSDGLKNKTPQMRVITVTDGAIIGMDMAPVPRVSTAKWVPGCRAIAMRAHNGQYVCAERGGGSDVMADRWDVRTHERLGLLGLDGNKIALRARNGQYLCAEGGGGKEVVANRTRVGPWETFELMEL